MPEIGQTVSHYKIIEKLGAGGMGVVYRAEDTNLNRQVAIKVLPEMFSGDPERMARFEREAKLLASLNHPNIAAIHGLEKADGKRFLVMELIEGETLAQRIAKGPLPVDEAMDVCRQIAEGVEAAHEKGVIHRDLKPANVKITPEGKVKVLDFGLAKVYQGESAAADASHSPTLTDQMTRLGVILGTAAYMAPEQAKGKAVDKRADIWAFGCILYECLTGKRAFEGETVTETLAAVIKGEPEYNLLPSGTSENVRNVLRRCLQKDPKIRLHDIVDARLEIEQTVPYPLASTALRHTPLRWVLTMSAVAILVSFLTYFVVRRIFQLPAPRVVKAVIQVEKGHWLAGNLDGFRRPTRTAVAFSHDGKFVIYSAVPENPKPGDSSRLFLRRIDQMDAKPITGTEGGSSPFISPDDRWVGFWSDDKKLMRIPLEGGTPVTLSDALYCFGASWGANGTIVYSTHENTGLLSIMANGGEPGVLIVPDRVAGEYGYRLPSWLPNDAGILFTVAKYGHDSHPQVAVLSLPTKDKRILLEDAADARYVSTGHIVFVRRGVLYAVPFDLKGLQLSGRPEPVAADVMQSLNAGSSLLSSSAAQYGFSDSGDLIFVTGGIVPDPQRSLVWVDFNGTSKEIVSFKAPFFAPRLAPDGRRIVYRKQGLKREIWTYDLERDINTPLISEGYAEWAVWGPSGNDITFGWTAAGSCNIFQRPADGSRPQTQIVKGDYNQDPGSWSKDGRFLAFVEEAHPQTGNDILIWDAQERRVIPFLESKFNERYPEFSPDGHWSAYSSDESGRNEIYVRPFPGPGAKHPISNSGGGQPLWSRNGKQLFFRLGTQVWIVDVTTAAGFQAGRPRMLFDQAGYGGGTPIRGYDISKEGDRFLMEKVPAVIPTPATQLILVQNWFQELKRLAPTEK